MYGDPWTNQRRASLWSMFIPIPTKLAECVRGIERQIVKLRERTSEVPRSHQSCGLVMLFFSGEKSWHFVCLSVSIC